MTLSAPPSHSLYQAKPPAEAGALPAFLPQPQARSSPTDPNSVPSSSVASSSTWVTKSLRTRRPSLLKGPGTPKQLCCPQGPQATLPHPRNGVPQLPIAHQCGVRSVKTSRVARALWQSRRRTPITLHTTRNIAVTNMTI